MVKTLYLLIILEFVQRSTNRISDCSNNYIFSFNDSSFVILAKSQLTSEQAYRFCSRYGGVLYIPVHESNTLQLRAFASQKFINNSDLVKVCAYSSTEVDSSLMYELAENGSCNKMPDTKFRKPFQGLISSMYLYSKNKSNAKIQISFCNSAGDSNPIVTQKSCSGDSKFMLYGSEVLTTTDNVIVIYPFSNSADSAVLSVNSVLSAFHLQQMPNLRNFTIPEISLFIGASSVRNSRTWIWDNGEMVVDSNFPLSSPELCEYMHMPLTYDDRVNLQPRNCTSQAYAACSINFDVAVQRYDCVGSLRVAWNNALAKVPSWDVSKIIVTAGYYEGNDYLRTKVSYTDYAIYFQKINLLMDHIIMVTVEHQECMANITDFAINVPSVAQSTRREKPPPVNRAVVTLQPNTNNFECLFEIVNNHSNAGIVFYEVLIEDQLFTIENLVDLDPKGTKDFSRDVVRKTFDFSGYTYWNVLPNAKIRAHNCIGASILVDVVGQCVNPFEALSFEQLVKYMVVFLSMLGAACVTGAYLYHWFLIYHSSEESPKEKTNLDYEDNDGTYFNSTPAKKLKAVQTDPKANAIPEIYDEFFATDKKTKSSLKPSYQDYARQDFSAVRSALDSGATAALQSFPVLPNADLTKELLSARHNLHHRAPLTISPHSSIYNNQDAMDFLRNAFTSARSFALQQAPGSQEYQARLRNPALLSETREGRRKSNVKADLDSLESYYSE